MRPNLLQEAHSKMSPEQRQEITSILSSNNKTMETQKEYRIKQFEKVSTEYTEYMPKIKIIKPNGETNWLDITETELKKIESVLILSTQIIYII